MTDPSLNREFINMAADELATAISEHTIGEVTEVLLIARVQLEDGGERIVMYANPDEGDTARALAEAALARLSAG